MYITTTATEKIMAMTKRIRICQGGTSASKTVSIILCLIALAQSDKNPTLTSIVSESFPHLRRGALRDFLMIMQQHHYFKDALWNKTNCIYKFETGSIIEFFSADQPDKLRGGRRDRLFINEVNNVSFDAFEQLEVRTKDLIFLDFNPTHEFWLFTDVLGKRDDIDYIKLNYLDNEALSQNIIDSIESRKNRGQWWKVYGLGELGELTGKIYTDWKIIDDIPHEARLERYGLNFGYCVDNRTEILTKKGWKTYDILTTDDEVLTLNSKTTLSEWQKVKAINIFRGRYEMWNLEKLGHSSFTTHNHRWLIENHGKYRFKPTNKLGGGDNIPAIRDCSSLPKKSIYTDAFVELMAWFWTEGQITAGGISIWQNEGKNAERIRKCLLAEFGDKLTKTRNGRNRAEAGWVERPKRDKLCHFAINLNGASRFLKLALDKVVEPEFISLLTKMQLDLFIDISVKADGSITKKGTRVITQSVIERLHSVQMACALAGIRTTLYPDRGKQWRLTIFKASRNVYINESKKQRYIFEGIVWCPTTKNGTWLARRNGTTYFTGNTNHPTGIVAIYYHDGGYILDEIAYSTGMLNRVIADTIDTQEVKVLTIADAAEPKSIDEIKEHGITIAPCVKGPDSVRNGIQIVQGQRISMTKRSINIIKEYRNYLWKVDKNGKSLNVPEEPFHYIMDCLVAGTLVKTKNGDKPIENIEVGELVATRKGFQKVKDAWLVNKQAKVRKVKFSNGQELVGTANHRIWTQNGWECLTNVRYGDIIELWKPQESTREQNITYIQNQKQNPIENIFIMGQNFYIERCGKMPTEKFQKIVISITKMVIHLITGLKTLSLLIKEFMANTIGVLENLLSKNVIVAIQNLNAILLGQWIDFVQINAKANGDGIIRLTTLKKNVNGVIKSFQSINMKEQDSVPVYVVQNMLLKQESPVYDITVNNQNEYFANGVLVHNSIRYGLVDILGGPKVDEVKETQRVEAARQQRSQQKNELL